MINRLLTIKGWRVISHTMLAAAGIGFIFLLSRMGIEKVGHGNAAYWWILGAAMAISMWMVVLGSLLAKTELTEKKK